MYTRAIFCATWFHVLSKALILALIERVFLKISSSRINSIALQRECVFPASTTSPSDRLDTNSLIPGRFVTIGGTPEDIASNTASP